MLTLDYVQDPGHGWIAAAARAELFQMAQALDDCNNRARNDHNHLHGA